MPTFDFVSQPKPRYVRGFFLPAVRMDGATKSRMAHQLAGWPRETR
nr:MAG TPA: hypothetical protein [Caudoviricetes sp.]DAK77134.1 MAG TPA: hypothetical protein [Caudoviricetes sp.]